MRDGADDAEDDDGGDSVWKSRRRKTRGRVVVGSGGGVVGCGAEPVCCSSFSAIVKTERSRYGCTRFFKRVYVLSWEKKEGVGSKVTLRHAKNKKKQTY